MTSRPRILYLHMAALGDAIMASAALRLLKEYLPDGYVAVVARSQSAAYFRKLPYVDEVIPFVDERHVDRKRPWKILGAGRDLLRVLKALRAKQWDAAIQWRGQLPDTLMSRWSGARLRVAAVQSVHRKALIPVEKVRFLVTDLVPVIGNDLHLVQVMAAPALYAIGKLLGKRPEPGDLALDYPTTEQDREEASRFLEAHSTKVPSNLVMIAFSTKSAFNTWPDERFAQVADHLQQTQGCTVVLSGLPEQRQREDRIALLMKTKPLRSTGVLSLGGLAALLSQCRLLIALNTGVSHMAAALGVPVLVLNGRDGASITPWGVKHRIVTRNAFYPLRHPVKKEWPLLVPRISPGEVNRAADELLDEIRSMR